MMQSSPPIDTDPSRGRRRVRLATLLGIALVIAYSVMPLIRRNASLGDVHTDLQAILVDWILVTALAVIGFGAERRPMAFFGLRAPRWRDLRSLALVLAAAVVVTVLANAAPPVQRALRSMPSLDVASIPFAIRFALVVTAGICIAAWSGSLTAGATISLVLFVLPHAWLYGFTPALIVPAILGGALTMLYVWRRNLPVCMLMHAILDGTMLLLVPAFSHAHGE